MNASSVILTPGHTSERPGGFGKSWFPVEQQVTRRTWGHDVGWEQCWCIRGSAGRAEWEGQRERLFQGEVQAMGTSKGFM